MAEKTLVHSRCQVCPFAARTRRNNSTAATESDLDGIQRIRRFRLATILSTVNPCVTLLA